MSKKKFNKMNVAVFISGAGTNLQSLIDAQGKVLQHGQISFVLSSSANAYGIIRAKKNNIPVLYINEKKVGNDTFYFTLEKHLKKYSIDLIVLAGYLPFLSEDFTLRWKKRIINIHPSLLPKYGGKGFYGLKIHKAVLENGDLYTGATIHYVTKDIDAGEIIEQEKMFVDADTPEELQRKVLQEIEWKLLPKVVEELCLNMIQNDKRYINIAVIGSGGREHALVRKISQSPLVKDIICLPGNDGIIEAENINISLNDFTEIICILKKRHIGLCIVGPEMSLAEGFSDCVRSAGILCFGPSKDAARIEYSKIFAKKLMKKYNIPTAQFRMFDNLVIAKDNLLKCNHPLVIKADGLCGGKGVFICKNLDESNAALELLMEKQIFGTSGTKIIIEEYLSGIEISIMVLTDGEKFVLLPSALDYKKAYDGNIGPNTGSMGAIAPHPLWTEELKIKCIKEIIRPTLWALKKEQLNYSGCLYFGLMLTSEGLKVLEYNSRFGDPETEVVLPLIENDIVPYLIDCSSNKLDQASFKIKNANSTAVILACKGYPNKYEKGKKITNVINKNVICCGVKHYDDVFVANNGRVVCAIGIGKTKELSSEKAYETVNKIEFENLFYRKDIGD